MHVRWTKGRLVCDEIPNLGVVLRQALTPRLCHTVSGLVQTDFPRLTVVKHCQAFSDERRIVMRNTDQLATMRWFQHG